MPDDPLARCEDPFAVLGVEPSASRAQIERAGQALQDALVVGLERARHFEDTQGHRRTRTPDMVRDALARLRDPDTRLLAELLRGPAPAADGVESPRFPDALARCGFGGRQ